MNASSAPTYLQPYLNATKKYGAGFGSLLWASPKTQAIRFSALLRAADCHGKIILDAGCGRADLLEFMLARRIHPLRYVGLEAVEELAGAAHAKSLPNCDIIRGDFVSEPSLMDIGADLVFFCGSLNTLDENTFYQSLLSSFASVKTAVIFNFLSSPQLAASPHLTWHRPEAVLAFAARLSADVQYWDNYLTGDATVAIRKESGHS